MAKGKKEKEKDKKKKVTVSAAETAAAAESAVTVVKPSAKKAAAKLTPVTKPVGRSAVRKPAKSGVQVKEVEVIKEVEVVKEVEKPAPYICLQYLGGESDVNEIVEEAKRVWQENNHSGIEFKSIDLYVKPEDNAAYYVINGTDTGKVRLGL